MPTGGKGSKRSGVNLEKHLQNKESLIRILNRDGLCMARALVGAKAKLDNDPRDRQIRDHRRPIQTRWAQELHKTPAYQSVPAELSKPNNFKLTLPRVKSMTCRKRTTITSSARLLRKTREFTSTCTTTIMASSPRCLDFSPTTTAVLPHL